MWHIHTTLINIINVDNKFQHGIQYFLFVFDFTFLLTSKATYPAVKTG